MKCSECSCTNFYTKKSGPHIGEYCTQCDKWIRWIPGKWQDFVWPVGTKHKGKKVEDILKVDKDYLEWASENLGGRLQKIAIQALNEKKSTKITKEPYLQNDDERDLPW